MSALGPFQSFYLLTVRPKAVASWGGVGGHNWGKCR